LADFFMDAPFEIVARRNVSAVEKCRRTAILDVPRDLLGNLDIVASVRDEYAVFRPARGLSLRHLAPCPFVQLP